jgi:hypothetical protein
VVAALFGELSREPLITVPIDGIRIERTDEIELGALVAVQMLDWLPEYETGDGVGVETAKALWHELNSAAAASRLARTALSRVRARRCEFCEQRG